MFRFLKRNDSEVITPEVVDMPVVTIQSNIAMSLALCMEEYLCSVSKTSVDIPNRDTLVREYNTLVDAGLGSSKNARLLQAKISEYNQIALDAMRAKNVQERYSERVLFWLALNNLMMFVRSINLSKVY